MKRCTIHNIAAEKEVACYIVTPMIKREYYTDIDSDRTIRGVPVYSRKQKMKIVDAIHKKAKLEILEGGMPFVHVRIGFGRASKYKMDFWIKRFGVNMGNAIPMFGSLERDAAYVIYGCVEKKNLKTLKGDD